MSQYKITFKTLDGNVNTVLIDAYSERGAMKQFEKEYQYDYVVSIEFIN